MANPEHLKILRQGVEAWHRWRARTPIHPDLSEADLSEVDLSDANLCKADRSRASLNRANVMGANLNEAVLVGIDLGAANLCDANLAVANLTGANLSDANLSDANFFEADLSRTVLRGAVFNGANLNGANLNEAHYHLTVLANTDLSKVKGLESGIHHGPSSLGIDTLFRSGGMIPEVFLRGAGVPDTFIQYAASLVGVPFEFYSCFISYSMEDEEFATRLYDDFRANSIRCWKWDHDALTGRSLWGEIDKAIRGYDKLVLIAGESSLKSPAVNREIERALVQEDQRLKGKLTGDSNADCDVLFPVRLDDFIFKGWDHERMVDVTKKVIADARGWANDPAVYRRVLERLLRDLKSDKSKPNPSAK